MEYVSTRNSSIRADFETVVLSGVAEDGGLYVPNTVPEFSSQDMANWSMLAYDELAFRIVSPFVGAAVPDADLKSILKESYDNFRHRTIAPLQQIDRNEWILELFHGPTHSSKDFSAQLQARFVDYFLTKRQHQALVTGATNGDTGLATIDAFKDSQLVKIAMFFPEKNSPDDQLHRIYSSEQSNLYRFAVDGTFDDCQSIVSNLFKQWPSPKFTAVSFNTSNWVGVMAQLVFYFYAALQLNGGQRSIAFTIPTSSFAEVYAAYFAQKMGLPITQIIIATNRNDALHQLFQKNQYSRKKADKSLSPAMDLSIFSNLERLLWELYGKDSTAVTKLMNELEAGGKIAIDNKYWLQARMIIDSYSVSDDETLKEIKSIYHDTGYVIDPHTATGLLAARLYRRSAVAPMVTLGEVSPQKSLALLSKLGIDSSMKNRQVLARSFNRLYRVTSENADTIHEVLSGL
jgi:threonine synthase